MLFEGIISSASGTETVCVTEAGALTLMATVTVKKVDDCGVNGSREYVQVTTWPLAEHEKPLPPPETNVNSGGNTSVITIEVAGAVPKFERKTE